jgi:hypothetical protein
MRIHSRLFIAATGGAHGEPALRLFLPRLRKLYFDAVTPDGRCRIAYRADISVLGVRLGYEELGGDSLAKPLWRLTFGNPCGRTRFGNSIAWGEWTSKPPITPWFFETASFIWRLKRIVVQPPASGDRMLG